jgi:hypothetical protein
MIVSIEDLLNILLILILVSENQYYPNNQWMIDQQINVMEYEVCIDMVYTLQLTCKKLSLVE